MEHYNIHAAKTQLSKLIERAEQGEEIVLARAGKPVARLVPYVEKRNRVPGLWKGKVSVADDFDAPLEDEALWYGE